MTIFEVLQSTGLPCAYSHFRAGNIPKSPPYIVYLGAGQYDMAADNTYYYRSNQYQVEYYFTEKNEETEATIEQLLLDNGYLYEKSEDTYIEDEGVFVIYYSI